MIRSDTLIRAKSYFFFFRYMTTLNFKEMARGPNFRTSLDSQTTESKMYSTPKIKIDGTSVSLKLRDTVGFGAKDMETKNILKDTFLDVVSDFEKIRGCILVHKCERFREGGYKDLEQIKQMFETMGLHFKKHLLLVITHTGHLSEETKANYSSDVIDKVIPEIPLERVVHVNFANLEELNDHHKEFFMNTAGDQFKKLMSKLREFEDEVAPVAKDIKEFIDNAYDKDLKKRKTAVSSVVDNVFEVVDGVKRRLSGEKRN